MTIKFQLHCTGLMSEQQQSQESERADKRDSNPKSYDLEVPDLVVVFAEEELGFC